LPPLLPLLPNPPVLTPDFVLLLEPLEALEVPDELLELRQVPGLYQVRERELLDRLVVGTVNEPPET
jgi:hypothetical protein